MKNPDILVPALDSHLGGCIQNGDTGDLRTWSPVVWRALLDSITARPIKVLDVGCGFGYSTKWFSQQPECGITNVVGLEGWNYAVKKGVYSNTVLHDLTKGPYTEGRFDLCWSCEFVEHLEEKFLPNLLHTFSLCDLVAMTHAVPGQGGHHHVNEQEAGYWIDKLGGIGYNYDEQESLRLRALIPPGDEGHFVRETLLIFRRSR